jgi:hypothetical protein
MINWQRGSRSDEASRDVCELVARIGLDLSTARTGLEENYRNFQELDDQKNQEVLRRINEDREKFNGARVKLNFFYVVLIGGRLLFFAGAVLSLVAIVRLIRRDARIKIKQLAESEEPAS